MAATLTSAGELTYASFPIDKVETDADGDLIVYGKASDGSIDSDQQIVDPSWMARAAQAWKESGANLRVQHNAQRDPAGVGLEVETDASGATWVKGLVVEPIAKKLVAKGALRAYSVGIARPTIARDAAARGGRITDGELVEISLVDRPANKRCGIQLVKAAGDGTPEYVNEVFGSDDDIAKALGADVTKAAPDDGDFVSVDLPKAASISISPADFARLRTFKQELVTKTAGAVLEADTGKRDVSTAERRSLAGEGNALPDGSYPINNTGDLHNAAHLARTGHGDAAAARRLIARRARELGVANPLDESDKSDDVAKSETGVGLTPMPLAPPDPTLAPQPPVATPLAEKAADAPGEQQEATSDVTKDPAPKPVKKAKKKPKGPKKMPPWLKGDDDGDSGSKDSDDDGDSDDASKACKSVSDHLWTGVPGTSDIVCSKCHTSPAQAAGVTASQMDPAPVKELLETPAPASVKGATPASASGAVGEPMKPVPAHREPDGAAAEAFEAGAGMADGDSEKAATPDLAPDPEVAALLRFKTLGVDEDLGRLHDLTCPAYSPDMAAKYHPYATLPGLIDSGTWQRKTLAAAAGPLEKALEMAELWQAVHVLKNADQGALNDWRLEVHKAFRDANPGPGSFPTPGSVSPQRYSRPVLTDGRGANAVDYSGPTTAPQVATSPPNAQDFGRPPLSSAQESPSPSFMKGGGAEYPAERGVPQRITYEVLERDKARRALSMLHDHLNHMFPSACPMLDQDAYRQPEARPVPAPAGIGKGDGDSVPAMLDNGYVVPAAALKATPEEDGLFADADVYKGFKRMRKKLGKKVLSGKMTVDEARARMGRQFAQKAAEPPAEAVQKAAAIPATFVAHGDPNATPGMVRELQESLKTAGANVVVLPPGSRTPDTPLPLDPDVIKAAVAEAASELKDLLVKQQETFTTKLAEQQRVIDAIADQPDPSTAAFSGLAFQPGVMKSRRPAAVPDQAEYAARAQAMIRRQLQNTYQTHSDPHVREAAGQSLATMGAGMEAPPMT